MDAVPMLVLDPKGTGTFKPPSPCDAQGDGASASRATLRALVLAVTCSLMGCSHRYLRAHRVRG